MTPSKRKRAITDLWKWLESRLHDINLKLDHILFRMREEDPRTGRPRAEENAEDNIEQSDEVTDI